MAKWEVNFEFDPVKVFVLVIEDIFEVILLFVMLIILVMIVESDVWVAGPIEDVVDPELINTEEENVTMFDGVEVLPPLVV